jgi:hypothetical protein
VKNDKKLEVLTAVTMTVAVFGNVLSCSLVKQTKVFEEYVSIFRVEEYLIVICSLFNDALSNSDYMASNDSMTVDNEMQTLCKEAFMA